MPRNPSSPARRRACAALLCAVLAGTAGAQTPADAATAFDNAQAEYERNHWDQAYAAFATLADQGHAEAARLAVQMWMHGPALYQREFPASARQLARWVRLWRGSGGRAAAPDCPGTPSMP